MQGSQHGDGGNGGARKLGRDVLGDAGKAEDIDVQHLAGSPRRFKILAAVVPQTEVQTFAGRGLLDNVGVTFELVPDRRSDEISAVRIEPFLHHQIDMTKVDITKIDRDFFGVGGLRPQFVDIARPSSFTIHTPSVWMVYGWSAAPIKVRNLWFGKKNGPPERAVSWFRLAKSAAVQRAFLSDLIGAVGLAAGIERLPPGLLPGGAAVAQVDGRLVQYRIKAGTIRFGYAR